MHTIARLEQASGVPRQPGASRRLAGQTRRRRSRAAAVFCARHGPITYADLAVIGVGLLALVAVRIFSDSYFDAASEAIVALGALCVLEMARNLRSFVADDYPLYLAVCLVIFAGLLLVHAAEMPGVALFGHSHGAHSVEAELAAGLVLAVSMLVAPFVLGQRLRAKNWIVALAPIALALMAAMGLWQLVPVATSAGETTALGNATSVAIAALLLGAMLLTYRRRRLLELFFLVAMEVALAAAALGWLLEATLPYDDFKHFMDVAFIALTYIAVTKNGLARPTALMVTDLKTQGQHAQALAERLAFYDTLTGLANRTLLHDRLRHALLGAVRTDSPLAVLHVDLDRFTDTNHLLGHRGADKVLQEVAARLAPIARQSDTWARFAADEFVLLLSESEGTIGAVRVGARIREALHAPCRIDGRELALSASVGVALAPNDGEDAETLLQHALIATQRAKQAGGGRLQFYDAAMGQAVAQRVRVEQELRRGLERGELLLYYQPQVELSSGLIASVEALLRWQHPQRGLLAPSAFLPVAEAVGLIEEITAWVAAAACRQAAAWQAAGLRPLRVAVNVSARDFRSGGVAALAEAALAESGLAPQWLEIELTETAIVEDLAATVSQLEALRKRGISLALDDFGTGFSSLTYLRSMPIQRVKIDRSFVSNVGQDGRDAAIVASLIELIHSLGLEAGAEGIESADELAFLRAHGCDYAQGYFFSEPLPADECAELFERDLLGVEVEC